MLQRKGHTGNQSAADHILAVFIEQLYGFPEDHFIAGRGIHCHRGIADKKLHKTAHKQRQQQPPYSSAGRLLGAVLRNQPCRIKHDDRDEKNADAEKSAQHIMQFQPDFAAFNQCQTRNQRSGNDQNDGARLIIRRFLEGLRFLLYRCFDRRRG